MTVDVVIPVHGAWELTERCLDSLRSRDACVRRVIVVDDASTDDTAARLRTRDDVEALVLERNRGFAGACNAGAARCDADAIFFLNNDTTVEPGTIDRLARTLEEPGVGAVAPRLLNGDGSLQCAGLALYAHRPSFARVYLDLDPAIPEAQRPYDAIAFMAAALLVRRSAFEAAGRFDKAYVNGFEDVDLCLTLWSMGVRCRYEPRATVVHLDGASRGKDVDDDANGRRFAQRWESRLCDVPRFDEGPPPVLALDWRGAGALEAALGDRVTAMLRRYSGAGVQRHATLAALQARLDRRRLLRIGMRSPHAADVRWCAPADEREARELVQPARAYWAASERAHALLVAAGAPREHVSTVRPGWPVAPPRPERAFEAVVAVCATDDDAAAIRRAAGSTRVETIVVARAAADCFERIAAADVTVFACDGDAWGALGTAAFAAGTLAIAPRGAPFVEIMPDDAYVALDAATDAAGALREVLRDPGAARARAAFGARSLARRNPDVHAGRRVRELARALVHGIVAPEHLAMTPALLGPPA